MVVEVGSWWLIYLWTRIIVWKKRVMACGDIWHVVFLCVPRVVNAFLVCFYLSVCFALSLKVNNFAIRHDVEMWRTSAGGNHMKSEALQGVTRDSRDQNYKFSGGFICILHGSTRTSMEGKWSVANDLETNNFILICNKDVDFLFE